MIRRGSTKRKQEEDHHDRKWRTFQEEVGGASAPYLHERENAGSTDASQEPEGVGTVDVNVDAVVERLEIAVENNCLDVEDIPDVVDLIDALAVYRTRAKSDAADVEDLISERDAAETDRDRLERALQATDDYRIADWLKLEMERDAAEDAASAMNDHADIIEGKLAIAEAKLARIAEVHTQHPENVVFAVTAFCNECGNDWPCDTVSILDEGSAS